MVLLRNTHQVTVKRLDCMLCRFLITQERKRRLLKTSPFLPLLTKLTFYYSFWSLYFQSPVSNTSRGVATRAKFTAEVEWMGYWMQFIAVHCHIPIVHVDMTMTIHFNLSRRRTLVTILLRGILFLPPMSFYFIYVCWMQFAWNQTPINGNVLSGWSALWLNRFFPLLPLTFLMMYASEC